MPRIFKGSESTLRLLIHKCNHYNSISDLKIVLFTGEDIDNHIEVVDGINVDGNMAVITLPARAFNNLEEGVINYIVEGVIDGDLFATERQSNYYLKTPLSYVVDDSLQIKDEYITENGNYTIYPDETYDGMSQVNLFVEVPDTNGSYDEGYNIGRGEGYNDGYANGQNDGYNSGREEVISQAESLYLTENGVYEGENLYNRVEVAVDVEEQYNKGYEDGANAASADAIVVDVTENGTIYTKYVEVPEWNEPLTGDDFYSYAYLQDISYNTGYVGDENTVFEVWFKPGSFPKNYGCVVGKQPVYGGETDKIFKISHNYSTQYTVEYGGKSHSFLINNLEEWQHFKLSYADGLVVNGEQIATFSNPVVYSDATFYINNNSADQTPVNGYFGMVKIDDNVYIPTDVGFINRNTGEPLEIYTSGYYTFYPVEKPVQLDNLIKQVNVKTSIPALDSMGIRLGYSTFTKVPESIKMSPTASYNNLFTYCTSLTDISPLANWDTGKVTSMSNMFSNCSNLTDISPLANWNTSNVRTISNMFSSCSGLKDISALANWNTSELRDINYLFQSASNITDASPMARWDTSKVTTMNSLFNGCTKLTTIPALNCSSIDTSYNSTAWFGYSEMTALTTMGGFINLKTSSTGSYGLNKCPNLTYESCINILNGLYDFTGNGETPASNQGKLKVHANFLTAVGDEISIGTNKGWTITA